MLVLPWKLFGPPGSVCELIDLTFKRGELRGNCAATSMMVDDSFRLAVRGDGRAYNWAVWNERIAFFGFVVAILTFQAEVIHGLGSVNQFPKLFRVNVVEDDALPPNIILSDVDHGSVCEQDDFVDGVTPFASMSLKCNNGIVG